MTLLIFTTLDIYRVGQDNFEIGLTCDTNFIQVKKKEMETTLKNSVYIKEGRDLSFKQKY